MLRHTTNFDGDDCINVAHLFGCADDGDQHREMHMPPPPRRRPVIVPVRHDIKWALQPVRKAPRQSITPKRSSERCRTTSVSTYNMRLVLQQMGIDDAPANTSDLIKTYRGHEKMFKEIMDELHYNIVHPELD